MNICRVIADGLIRMAELRPRSSEVARLLRDAAASLLDADMAMEREEAHPEPERRDAA